MVQALHDLLSKDGIEETEIDAEAGFRIGRAADHRLEDIVVAVAMRIVARAKHFAIALVTPFAPMITMRGAESYGAGQVDGHLRKWIDCVAEYMRSECRGVVIFSEYREHGRVQRR